VVVVSAGGKKLEELGTPFFKKAVFSRGGSPPGPAPEHLAGVPGPTPGSPGSSDALTAARLPLSFVRRKFGAYGAPEDVKFVKDKTAQGTRTLDVKVLRRARPCAPARREPERFQRAGPAQHARPARCLHLPRAPTSPAGVGRAAGLPAVQHVHARRDDAREAEHHHGQGGGRRGLPPRRDHLQVQDGGARAPRGGRVLCCHPDWRASQGAAPA